MANRTLRIVLAEDSALLREGLVALLVGAGHEVVASAENAEDLVAAVRADPPDVVITDVRMPPGHSDEGLRAAAEIREDFPSLPILVLSQYVADAYVPALMESAGSLTSLPASIRWSTGRRSSIPKSYVSFSRDAAMTDHWPH